MGLDRLWGVLVEDNSHLFPLYETKFRLIWRLASVHLTPEACLFVARRYCAIRRHGNFVAFVIFIVKAVQILQIIQNNAENVFPANQADGLAEQLFGCAMSADNQQSSVGLSL